MATAYSAMLENNLPLAQETSTSQKLGKGYSSMLRRRLFGMQTLEMSSSNFMSATQTGDFLYHGGQYDNSRA